MSNRAAVFLSYGGPDRLAFRDLPAPEPSPGRMVVRVAAAALNPIDWKLRSGSLRFVMPIRFPFVPGGELAGIVERVAPGSPFAVGDPVLGPTPKASGAFAELAVVEEDKIARWVPSLSIDQAAGLSVPGLTALQALRDRARLSAGQRLLVNGAAGSVGSMAVQIGTAFGAEVTAVTSARNADFVRTLGAREVIDYRQTDFTALGRRWDVIFDVVPNRSFWSCRAALEPRGVYVTTMPGPGPFLASAALMAARPFGARRRSHSLLLKQSRADLEQLVEWAAAGRITVPVGQTLPFERLADAFALSETGHARGRIIVRIARE